MKFSEIIGQQETKKRLIQSVKDQRISHAQLFLGKTGSGSLALAIAYAQYISCEKKSDQDSCGECRSCIKYQKYIHPDLHFAYPISLSKDVRNSTQEIVAWREALIANPYLVLEDWFGVIEAENKQPIIGAEESAEILRKLSLTAFESEYKVMIIWMAEKMNPSAGNKLLKILEEPPEKTLFLLIAEDEDQLLRTILSRTQLVKVKRIDELSMIGALMKEQNLSEEEAKGITALAEGDYRAAQKLIQDNETIAFNLSTFQLWMRACLRFDLQKINTLITKFSDLGRERQKNFLGYCLHMVRECLMTNYGLDTLVLMTSSEQEFIKRFAPYVNGKNCLQFTSEFNKAYWHIERNANPKILFLDVSFKVNEFLHLKAGHSPE